LTLLAEPAAKHSSNNVRIGAILGLGLSYAGSARFDLYEIFSEILGDPDVSMEVLAITAYSLGLIFVGTCNADIASLVTDILLSKSEESLNHAYTKFMCLGLGLLYLGKQSLADLTLETLKVLQGPYARYAQFTVECCAYAGTGDVLKVQEMLQACGEHLEENNEFQSVAVLGISLIAMGEEIGSNMAVRAFNHLLQYGDPIIRRTVPLALGLISISNPQLPVMDTLSKLSHDSDVDVAQGAIFALGMIGAGTNNSRIAGLLRQLSGYYLKDPDHLFTVRIAQGLLHLGKGLLSLNPYNGHGNLVSKVGLAGILGVMYACFDFSCEYTLFFCLYFCFLIIFFI
jgi:26S proteasome regulatory subunit N1